MDQLIGRHVLAQHERALLERTRELIDRRDEDERAAVTEETLVLEPGGDGSCRVPRLDKELDLRSIGRGRRGQGGPEVLPDDALDEGHLERGRIVLGDRHDRAGHDRPKGREGDGEDDSGRDERKAQELQEADEPVPATTTPAPRPRYG